MLKTGYIKDIILPFPTYHQTSKFTMKFESEFILISIFFFLVGEAMGVTSVVYCENPITNDLTVSFCGTLFKTKLYFPGSLGYAGLNDGANIVTSIWNSPYISVYTSKETTSTSVRKALLLSGGDCPNARLGICEATFSLFSATITHFTVYAPTGDVATQVSKTTVTATVTSVSTKPVTATVTSVSTKPVTSTVTSVSILLVTSTVVSMSTLTVNIGNTAADTVIYTVTVTGGEGTCHTAGTTTITQKVSYCIGSGGVTTIYTPGEEPGSSTYVSCPDTLL